MNQDWADGAGQDTAASEILLYESYVLIAHANHILQALTLCMPNIRDYSTSLTITDALEMQFYKIFKAKLIYGKKMTEIKSYL